MILEKNILVKARWKFSQLTIKKFQRSKKQDNADASQNTNIAIIDQDNSNKRQGKKTWWHQPKNSPFNIG